MNRIKVLPRLLSLGEKLENQRRARSHRPTDTETKSVKVAPGWYKLHQTKKAK